MPKLIYTNELGQSIEFSNRKPFILENVEGLGDIEADIQTQKAPYQDGETHIDTVLEPRYIDLEISVVGSNVDELRRYLSRVMNPKISGTLRYEDEEVVREIDCINEHVPNFPTKNQNHHVAIVNLIAPNPYWKSIEQISEPMTAYVGLFQFPLQLPTEFGTVGSKQIFINDGDVPAPVQIEFKGPATNPRVTNNTTGEFIQVNRELLEGQSLIVNTEFGNKRVEIDGVNVINWIDLNSTFWQLVPGANEIEYTADAGRDNAVVGITWRNHYVGV